jgi:hypothetical protein
MSSQMAMTLMGGVEFALWVVLSLLFWTRKLQRHFPAMGIYLGLHVVASPVLLVLFHGQAQHWFNDYCFAFYFFAYWTVYIASAVLLFFVCFEVFRSALSAFQGLVKLGTVIFRWAVLASVIVSFSSIFAAHRGVLLINDVALSLMRSVSILELCLLGFLCLSMNALNLSVRDRTFGIALGFGLMSSNDFVAASLASRYISLTAPSQFVYESLTLTAIGIWVTYCALPEPVRKPVLRPVNSTIYRWNEIASALGHTGTKVAVQQPADSFFLTDVERVVEKVLRRNLQGNESEP